MRALALLILAASPLSAQTCELRDATPVTCLALEYVRALSTMAQAEETSKVEARSDSDKVVSGFYALKTRMNTEWFIRLQLHKYRVSKDAKAATAGTYADQVFAVFYVWDSTSEANLRRIVRMKSSVAEMQELTAEYEVHGDESLKLLFATAGEILDASLIIEGPSTPITKRRMTIGQRDQIVAEIDRAFAGHLSIEPDGLWYSGWAATAANIRDNLLEKGWLYMRTP
jgi:hypothetical protein